MTDPDGPDPTADETTESSRTLPETLLALQAVDTEANQLEHRRAHSPLRADFVDATNQTRLWEQQRDAFRTRIDELGAEIEQAERARCRTPDTS